MAKCQICKTREAEYAMQYIASEEPSFYFLGSHIRGFPVTKVCTECYWNLQIGEVPKEKDAQEE